MRRLLIVTMLLLLMQATARDSGAARLSLLLLDAPVQKVDIAYQFDGDQQAKSSERQTMIEDYGFKINYGILRPSILKGSLMSTLRFDQKLSSANGGDNSSSSNIAFLYSIDGLLLGESAAPGSFSLISDITRISTPFTRTYQLTNKEYDFRWTLKNKRFPVTVEYLTGTSVSSGLLIDSTRDNNVVNLRAGHRRNNSSTSLELKMIRNTYIPVQGEGNFDNRSEAIFTNSLFWADDSKSRNFDTRLDYSETAGINFAKYLYVDQSAVWDLGKSLKSGANYSLSTVAGDPGLQTHHSGALWIQHQLFKSLITRITSRVRKDIYPTGDAQEVGGDASLAYAKQLPQLSSLSLGVSYGYSVDDRNLGIDRQKIFNEQHVVTFGIRIPLGQPNVVSSSIIIRNADPLKRLLPYIQDIDYQIVPNGALTEIVSVASGAIGDGDTLLISYDIQVDPHFKSINESIGANASLGLFGGDYRISGSHTQSRQDRLAGQASLATLTVQQMSSLTLERRWNLVTLSTEYETFDSAADRHQSVQSMARYSDSLPTGNMSLMFSERYQWYGVVTQGNAAVQRAAENLYTVAANYTTSISSTIQLSLLSKYDNVSGASSSDSVMAGSSLRWSLGRLNATLETSLGMHRQESTKAFNEAVRISVTRYF